MARPRILFICIGNSCRSPMAESIARSLGGDQVEASSAGLAPLGWVAAQTIAALDSLGYETQGLVSKGLDAVEIDEFDIIVSLLGKHGFDHLPHGGRARREAWPIPDPFGEDDEMYLNVAHQLEDRIRQLLAEESETELFPS